MLTQAVDAGRSEALTPLGLVLRDLGRLDEAETVLLKAAARHREHTEAEVLMQDRDA